LKGAKGLNWILLIIILFMAITIAALSGHLHNIKQKYFRDEKQLQESNNGFDGPDTREKTQSEIDSNDQVDQDFQNNWNQMQD